MQAVVLVRWEPSVELESVSSCQGRQALWEQNMSVSHEAMAHKLNRAVSDFKANFEVQERRKEGGIEAAFRGLSLLFVIY